MPKNASGDDPPETFSKEMLTTEKESKKKDDDVWAIVMDEQGFRKWKLLLYTECTDC